MDPNTITKHNVYVYDTSRKEYNHVGNVAFGKDATNAHILDTIKKTFPPLQAGFELRFAPAGTSVQSKYQEKNMIKSTINSASALQAAASASKFVVGSFDNLAGFSMAPTPTLHDTAVLARGEAARLAKLNPGKYYVFLQIRGGEFVKPEPAVTSF